MKIGSGASALISGSDMRAKSEKHTFGTLLFVLGVLLAAMPFLPQWSIFLLTVALAKGLVVLGLMLLMRTGLVSFGQGLYYGLGAYAAAMLGSVFGVADVALMILASVVVTAAVAAVLGLLMARYRHIFFAMLTLAFSMVLYGLLVNTAALGSTDGFKVAVHTIFGIQIGESTQLYVFFALASAFAFLAAWGVHRYLASHLGRLSMAVRDNELRVEYLGASVRRTVYINYLLSSILAGAGGGLAALAIGHIDPDAAYWSASGEFVFVTVLSGTGSVMAPFLGSMVFETIRSFAAQYFPNLWQVILGIAMLLIILFLPGGLWTMFRLERTR
ncbi:MAG: branched-chain amino acid ABC transporter permease [Burkholderiales bacterium]|nr:branched-chain amino acid ABC transporter permease [Burkholderiales bacterium]